MKYLEIEVEGEKRFLVLVETKDNRNICLLVDPSTGEVSCGKDSECILDKKFFEYKKKETGVEEKEFYDNPIVQKIRKVALEILQKDLSPV